MAAKNQYISQINMKPPLFGVGVCVCLFFTVKNNL